MLDIYSVELQELNPGVVFEALRYGHERVMSNTNDPARDESEMPENDPRDVAPPRAEEQDPHSGTSDDPRVDPTPDRRQSS